MSLLIRIRHTIPLVKLFPISTLGKRLSEKISVVSHSLGLTGAKIVGEENGNLILRFSADCEIGEKGQLVKLPRDEVIFQHVKTFGEWGGIESDFLAKKIHELTKSGVQPSQITFVDMGANVGLVSTQTLNKAPKGVRCLAVEPLPVLVEALDYNFKSLVSECDFKILPYALGHSSGFSQISIDPRNFGSSSLAFINSDSKDRYLLKIQVVNALEFANVELHGPKWLIIKSDLESFDCEVLSLLPVEVWNRIFAGVVEVTSGPDVDLSGLPTLLNYLEHFTVLSWDSDLNKTITIESVKEFWESKSFEIRNLYFTR